ncbi:MAG: hypothetical protein EOP38_25145 [Rubrivivax sp.]|nr:MAG: hypothetical protein EOP38_25145 [Rubrivivax sp.]
MSRLYIALAIAAALGAGVLWHGHAVDGAIADAIDGDRRQWQDKARDIEQATAARYLTTMTAAAMAALENDHAQDLARHRLQADVDRARAQLGGLQGVIAAGLRSGGGFTAEGATPIQLADGARALAESLSECGSRYVAVGETADRLSIQVTGLQRYVTQVVAPVCLAPVSE